MTLVRTLVVACRRARSNTAGVVTVSPPGVRHLVKSIHCRSSVVRRTDRPPRSRLLSDSSTVVVGEDDDVGGAGVPLLRRIRRHAESGRTLLLDVDENERNDVSYADALASSSRVAGFLRRRRRSASSSSRRRSPSLVAHVAGPPRTFVAAQWGAWAAGHGSVPLATSHRVPELEHVLSDADPELVVVDDAAPNARDVVEAASRAGVADRLVRAEDLLAANDDENDDEENDDDPSPSLDDVALVLYTSGTTGRPKGVVTTHRAVHHQITDLVTAWEWEADDVATHVLPLHHVHGVVNVLGCAVWAGAALRFRKFDPVALWRDEWGGAAAADGRGRRRRSADRRPTVLMAVPTVYARLLEAVDDGTVSADEVRRAVEDALGPHRLQVSGSAALPASVFERWRVLTGHALLERYGSTEFAMALSNPYRETDGRRREPGFVGTPLPSVEVRIVDETTGADVPDGAEGGLRVRGPTLLREYLRRPDATRDAFDDDGFFRTGDVASHDPVLGSYRILGRADVDIVKSGGHKLSALEIERALLEHPDVAEIAVLGVPDDVWGQRVGAVCRTKTDAAAAGALTSERLREWCSDKMANYAAPTRLVVVDEIPKNAMGKVNKKALLAELFGNDGATK